MKRNIFLIIASIAICHISCKYNQNIQKKDNEDISKYYIKQIKKDKSLYIIYAQRNDSIFKIISDKESGKNCQNQIKVGHSYNLDLSITFPAEKLYGEVGLDYVSHISFSYKKSTIKAEKESHYKIYIANNLEGLCLINN
ncbi:MAG: hypothetical protein LBV43_07920 [Prevotella sp.]|jgi:hypothetical protein|nr:hypothetical protein [Prevotella sp.]